MKNTSRFSLDGQYALVIGGIGITQKPETVEEEARDVLKLVDYSLSTPVGS